MVAMTVLPREGNWTVDDLDLLPDDGLQYELIDGLLVVNAAPLLLHQRVVVNLVFLLKVACPPHLEVYVAPVDFRPHRTTSVQPDVLVVRRDDLVRKDNITAPPLLVVEVLSPSTRRKDLVLKHSVYADAGVASYWTVDPNEPSVTCWELVEGRYVEAGRAQDSETVTVSQPYEVTLCPRDLIRG